MNITIDFGEHIGKSLEDLQKTDPQYLLWLAGVKNIYSLKKDPQGDAYLQICQDFPKAIEAAKQWIKGRCYKCWAKEIGPRHFCDPMKHSTFYHYHPYGKR